MDDLIRTINEYPNGKKLIVIWKNGLKIEGEIDTIYETNNCMDEDEEGYHEYFACALKILSLVKSVSEELRVGVGMLIEISMQDPPMEVQLENGNVIWRNVSN